MTVTTQELISTLRVASTATVDLNSLLQPDDGAKNAGTIIVGEGGGFSPGSSGTGGLTNTGTITIETGGAVGLFGTIVNSGLIDAVGSSAFINPETDPCVLIGEGNIRLDGGTVLGGESKRFPTYLTNVDNSISGWGQFQRLVVFTNAANGVVDAGTKGAALTFASSGLTLVNAGLIEATNHGVCKIQRAVDNTGILEAIGGTLELAAAVTGPGEVNVAAGKVVIANAGAAESVTFTGKGGALELDQSQTYAGGVSGFSLTGQTTLDLRDIAFVSPSEATYSGTATSGVLTVTDGTHTAKIKLIGDYTNATFVALDDGKGGVNVVAESAQSPSVARFASVMAGLTGHLATTGLIDARAVNDGRQMMLTAPRLALA